MHIYTLVLYFSPSLNDLAVDGTLNTINQSTNLYFSHIRPLGAAGALAVDICRLDFLEGANPEKRLFEIFTF